MFSYLKSFLYDNEVSDISENDSNQTEFDDIINMKEKDRHILSFKNGIYMMNKNKFIPYDDDNHVKKVKCTSKYHDMIFEDNTKQENWYKINTPTFQTLLDDQFKDENDYEEICKWFYVMCGRMLYNVGDRDNWQVMTHIIGKPRTGKTTLLNTLKEIYEKKDIFMIDNNHTEKYFSIPYMADMNTIIGNDVISMKLRKSDFLKIISGEEVMSQQLFQRPKKFNVRGHVMLTGNKRLDYEDGMGEIKRRTILFMLQNQIKLDNIDTEIYHKLLKELPNIIQKINCAYIEYSEKYNNQYIWKVLPQYFQNEM